MKWTDGHPEIEQLGAYHDRELEASQARAVQDHLDACPRCREALGKIGQVDAFGALLRDDVPADADPFWSGLAERTRERVRREGRPDDEGWLVDEPAAGRDDGEIPAMAAAAARVTPPPAGWWRRTFGSGPFLRWGLATAAGIVVVVLASRVVVHQLSPAHIGGSKAVEQFSRGEVQNPPTGELSSPPYTPDASSTRAKPPAGARNGQSLADRVRETGPGAAASAAPPSATPSAKSAASAPRNTAAGRTGAAAPTRAIESSGPADHVALLEETGPPAAAVAAGSAAPALAAGSAAPAAGSETAAPRSPSIAPAPATAAPLVPGADTRGSRAPGHVNEALEYAALVDRELRSAADSNLVIIPPPPPDGGETPRFRDYSIAFTAALRALEDGRPELARRGFSLVARGIPETGLARDAEYNERLAQVRVLQAQGEENDLVLHEAQDRADAAWDLAQTRKITVTCRAALAFERVRITLLKEMRPDTDLKPFEERIRILKECS